VSIGALTAAPQAGVPWWGTLNTALIGSRPRGGLPPGFVTPPSQWDVVLFGPNNEPLPGLAKIKRCVRTMKLHRKDHPSSSYETQTFQGYSVVEFDFELVLWTPTQLSNLSQALPYIFPGSGDSPTPTGFTSVTTLSATQNIVNPTLNTSSGATSTQQVQTQQPVVGRPPLPVKLTHPALQVHGVDAVVFVSMDGPLQRSENFPDIFVVRFKTVQFKPSRPNKHKTLNQTSTLGTQLGELGQPGLGVLQQQFLPPSQQPDVGPSAGGGADPFGTAQYSNTLLGPLAP
jgi:hypothetical protein